RTVVQDADEKPPHSHKKALRSSAASASETRAVVMAAANAPTATPPRSRMRGSSSPPGPPAPTVPPTRNRRSHKTTGPTGPAHAPPEEAEPIDQHHGPHRPGERRQREGPRTREMKRDRDHRAQAGPARQA